MQARWRALGAALIATVPVAAMADEAPAVSQLALTSGQQGTNGFNPSAEPVATGSGVKLASLSSDPAAIGTGVKIASIPSDGAITPPPLAPGGSGLYIETGASWQHIDLPSVSLGMVNLTGPTAAPPFGYGRPTVGNTFSAAGVGGDLAVGYHLPTGWVPPSFGAAPRVELDFSIVDASRTRSTSATPQVDVGSGTVGMMLNGTPVNAGPVCNLPGLIFCSVTSSASSHYQDWHLGLKGATDFQFGMVTVSPSLSLIGGEDQNDIRVSQNLQQFVLVAATPIPQIYTAKVKLHSDDVGGKLGLNLKFPLANGLSAALGGSLALVDRETTLHGNDLFLGTPGVVPAPPLPSSPFSTSTSSSKSRAALLSNVEGSLNFTVTPAVSFRLFGGMNYDDSIPGVKSPTFVGTVFAPTSTTPARIKFVSEISYYSGAGVSIHF